MTGGGKGPAVGQEGAGGRVAERGGCLCGEPGRQEDNQEGKECFHGIKGRAPVLSGYY